MRRTGWFWALVACFSVAATAQQGCSAGHDNELVTGSGPGSGQGGGAMCGQCSGNTFEPCAGDPVLCDPDVCVPGMGCLPCVPGGTVCVGNSVHECTDQGQVGDPIETCDVGQGLVCNNGACTDECTVADQAPSNVGCEFWAVDLPNERGINNAAAAAWGVVLSNAGVATAQVTIEKNDALPGDPLALSTVMTLTIPADQLEAVELPRAEITGWTPQTADPPGPPMTWLSSNAFRITSTAPLVVYQFNVFTNSYANDASLLLPRNGLGMQYRILGYPTANPISVFPLAGIPDRSSVTVVGTAPGTSVTVTTSTNTIGNTAGIPALTPGGSHTATLGPFDVLNISSDGIPGDMTGTIVVANKPVAVFSSGERAISPTLTTPPEPPGGVMNFCCTDHIEEQVFPVTSMGKQFVVTRSPIRSDMGFAEADELRFMGVAAPAQVTTNLPAPMNAFTLQPGQVVDTWTDRDIVVESDQPIAIAQILVSAAYTTTYDGDPSLTIFPAAEQYRSEYLFLVPSSWDSNYFVIAAPKGGSFELDGSSLTGCINADAGQLVGVEHEAIRCPVPEGAHRVTGDMPFGLTVYGYGNVGSYAFAGGADVKPIYEPPPLE